MYLAVKTTGHMKCNRKLPAFARSRKTWYLLMKPNQPSSMLSNTDRSKNLSAYHDNITDSPMTIASPSAVGDSILVAMTVNTFHRNVYTRRIRASVGTSTTACSVTRAYATSR
ncbi:hypothetical protein PPTG_23834 [Phytophthora nicotianae INRA-310]|uniref:Uncharacterized protein n=4 Tax=Phytophthora nicotianae TaxID=4792 RepID=W2PR43_PHYN3|nr:hypothetical protein PPTG_23834 [Phytophthora nicotianae INRA-310]ETI37546.1 hypothetical protein F443_16498 [Phytophthora nicotianae P1569]ETM37648.1 hypothetical protein L914_15859 [Phytophthora nicotianae]ETN03131.1 hypothetical protein PPTG_23834 [Phytophthora nicotianae INRA-310]ETO66330.1 hypothetical protein F444_16462 [Phytophthora nicotianae P1976]